MVRTLFVDVFGGAPYIVMEYVDGVSLEIFMKEHVRRDVRLPAGVAVSIANDIAKALDFAYTVRDTDGKQLGMFHRDVKPANIPLTRNGIAKLSDFGVAVVGNVTATGKLTRTPSYMSPEQNRGEPLDNRSDVFSLGVVLYELLGGTRAFSGGSLEEVLGKVRNVDIAPLRHWARLPDDKISYWALLEGILRKALAPRPAQRFASAGTMAEALQCEILNPLNVPDRSVEAYIHGFIENHIGIADSPASDAAMAKESTMGNASTVLADHPG